MRARFWQGPPLLVKPWHFNVPVSRVAVANSIAAAIGHRCLLDDRWPTR
jgi:hypothetical protein